LWLVQSVWISRRLLNALGDARRPFAVHLILGDPDDPCCAGVFGRLRERGLPARLLGDPLAPPARFAWNLDDEGLESSLSFDDQSPAKISSVLVRDTGWLDPAGWDPTDYAYVQAEMRAALLAWLAGLPCPVINRPSAAFWYRPRMSMLAWQPLLRRAGLPTPETLLTNDPAKARDFGRQLEADGAGGAVCTPLTGDAAWLITGSDWSGLATLQELAPVCLTEPHGQARCACVVGDRIIWDETPLPDLAALAPSLLRLAEAAELDVIEVAVASVRRGPAVVLVEPLVRLDHFRAPTRELILDAHVDVLTGETARVRQTEEASP
jgi:hypothetical protein